MAERKQPTPSTPDAVLRALADPHRRQILRLVQHTELPAGQIAASFTLTQQAVSQHIGVLKQAGLLSERREGTRRLYALRHGSLEPLHELLSEFWPDALRRLKKAVDLTVDPPYRVVFSWGIPGSDALPPGGSTVEVVLTPDGDDTTSASSPPR